MQGKIHMRELNEEDLKRGSVEDGMDGFLESLEISVPLGDGSSSAFVLGLSHRTQMLK